MLLTRETNLYQTDAIKDGITAGASTAVNNYDQNVLDQMRIFNKLTNNGQAQGIYLDNGKLYLNFEYAVGQTLKLGKANNTGGTLEIYDSSNTRVGLWNNGALYIGNISGTSQTPSSPNTKIGTNGAIETKSLKASNYINIDAKQGYNCLIKFASLSTEYSFDESGFFAKATDGWGGTGIAKMIPTSSSSGSFARGFLSYLSSDGYCNMSTGKFANLEYNLLKIQSGYSRILLEPSAAQNVFEIRDSTNLGVFYITNTGYFMGRGGCSVYGTKSRCVETHDYGERLLYCYETPSPLFGDVGEGTIGDDGKCYVMIDSIFAETVTLSQYQVFLQKYGDGDCWVSERKSAYFIVEGTPGLSFGWELKAKQSDFDQLRMENNREPMNTSNSEDYASLLTEHINQLREERTVNAA